MITIFPTKNYLTMLKFDLMLITTVAFWISILHNIFFIPSCSECQKVSFYSWNCVIWSSLDQDTVPKPTFPYFSPPWVQLCTGWIWEGMGTQPHINTQCHQQYGESLCQSWLSRGCTSGGEKYGNVGFWTVSWSKLDQITWFQLWNETFWHSEQDGIKKILCNIDSWNARVVINMRSNFNMVK